MSGQLDAGESQACPHCNERPSQAAAYRARALAELERGQPVALAEVDAALAAAERADADAVPSAAANERLP